MGNCVRKPLLDRDTIKELMYNINLDNVKTIEYRIYNNACVSLYVAMLNGNNYSMAVHHNTDHFIRSLQHHVNEIIKLN